MSKFSWFLCVFEITSFSRLVSVVNKSPLSLKKLNFSRTLFSPHLQTLMLHTRTVNDIDTDIVFFSLSCHLVHHTPARPKFLGLILIKTWVSNLMSLQSENICHGQCLSSISLVKIYWTKWFWKYIIHWVHHILAMVLNPRVVNNDRKSLCSLEMGHLLNKLTPLQRVNQYLFETIRFLKLLELRTFKLCTKFAKFE